MDTPIVPSDSIDTRLPIYAAFGLSKAESDAVWFEVSENLIRRKTISECLIAIAESKRWNDKQKIWAAYNLRTEVLIKRGIPRFLITKLDG